MNISSLTDFNRFFYLFRKDERDSPIVFEPELTARTASGDRIQCPKCNWEPKKESLWVCWECIVPEGFLRGCGENWNTFDTKGVCPGCQHQWTWTSCLSCRAWSLHKDWYVSNEEL